MPVWRCVGDYRGALCPQRRARVMMCKGNAGKSAEWLWSRHVGAVMGPSQADGSADYLTLWHTHWLEVWVEAGINLITTWVWWRHCFSLLHAGGLRYRAAAAHSPVISALPEGAKKAGEREGARERKWLHWKKLPLTRCVCCLHVWVIFYTHRHWNCSEMSAWRPYDCLQIDQSPTVSVKKSLNSLIPAILDIWGRPLHLWETLIDVFQHFLVIYGRNYWSIDSHQQL